MEIIATLLGVVFAAAKALIDWGNKNWDFFVFAYLLISQHAAERKLKHLESRISAIEGPKHGDDYNRA